MNKTFLYSPLPSNEWMESHHLYQWFYDGFWSPKPLVAMVFQWFPMVAKHWSDNGMVTIHRSGLIGTLFGTVGNVRYLRAFVFSSCLLVSQGKEMSLHLLGIALLVFALIQLAVVVGFLPSLPTPILGHLRSKV